MTYTIRILFAALTLCVGAAWAEHASTGTWKLNPAKSKSSDALPRSAATLTIQNEGPNVVFGSTRYIRDGKEHPYEGGGGRYDTYMMTAPNDHETTSVYKKGGKVVRTVKTKVSKDGKVWTSEAKGVDENGKQYHTVSVYDRQ